MGLEMFELRKFHYGLWLCGQCYEVLPQNIGWVLVKKELVKNIGEKIGGALDNLKIKIKHELC